MSSADAAADVASTPAPGNCAPSWTTTPACGGGSIRRTRARLRPERPHLRPVDVDGHASRASSTPSTSKMDADQFDNGGYAYFFKPGQYASTSRSASTRTCIGLGQSPDDVVITGAVRAKADWLGDDNATCNFWRTRREPRRRPDRSHRQRRPTSGRSRRARALRRVAHSGLDCPRRQPIRRQGNWASGGFIADSKIDTQINSGSQQQFLTRNDDLTNWHGFELEHGLRRRRAAPLGHLAEPAVHRRPGDARRAREAVSLRRRQRQLSRHGPGAEDEQHRLELGDDRGREPGRRGARSRSIASTWRSPAPTRRPP